MILMCKKRGKKKRDKKKKKGQEKEKGQGKGERKTEEGKWFQDDWRMMIFSSDEFFPALIGF